MNRRIVITGIGVVAPGAIGTKPFWELLLSGTTATRAISTFDATPFRSRIAAECDFDPVAAGLSAEQARRLDRAGQFALVAGQEALADSGLRIEEDSAHRVGVCVGTAVGCTQKLESEYVALSAGGRRAGSSTPAGGRPSCTTTSCRVPSPPKWPGSPGRRGP
ncbi:hypothetical protein SVIOM74S_00384 [Streptomyces violarus]